MDDSAIAVNRGSAGVPADDRVRELLDRIRASLPAEGIREVRMFGVVALMMEDALLVGVHKDGSLLVRVDPAEEVQLLEAPDATRARSGAGRSMGAGWIRVEERAVHSDDALLSWLECATRYNSQRKTPSA